MLDHDTILTVSTLVAAVPAVGLWVHYCFATRWWESDTGKAIFGLLVVAILGLGIRPVSLIWPEFFLTTEPGFWIRASVGPAVAAVLINLWRVLILAQREGRDKD